MSRKTTVILLLALSAPIVAHAETVTYDFTGSVTSSSGFSALPVGASFSGIFTFDYANATAASGTVGSSSWDLYGTTAPLFTTSVPGVYSTAVPNSTSQVVGSVYFAASEAKSPASSFSTLNINSLSGSFSYDAAGLPLFGPGSSGHGTFGYNTSTTSGEVDYSLTSLTPAPVPLPAAAWLLLSGLGALGLLRRTGPSQPRGRSEA